MTLADLKHFLQLNKVASLNDLTVQFDTDPDTIKDMVNVWIRKGKVRKVEDLNIGCGKCCACKVTQDDIYEWIGEEESEAS